MSTIGDIKGLTVIKCDTLFWIGGKWSREYPEAKRYNLWPSVAKLNKATDTAKASGMGNALSVYVNYGMENQRRRQFVDGIVNEGDLFLEHRGEI